MGNLSDCSGAGKESAIAIRSWSNSVSFMKCTLLFCSIVFCSAIPLMAQGPHPGTWDIKRLQSEVPPFRIEDPLVPIRSVIYEGEMLHGEPTEVFAFYASPRTLGASIDPKERFPAVVLIHGGGGTAFAEWVWLWAERGYAAIAMDLSGSRPPDPKFDENGQLKSPVKHAPRVKLERGGLNHSHKEKFESIGGLREDDWPFHAVANVMRAHSLIASFDEVDADRTAVTGISWGGYTTCLVASLDDRFKAAVPVYGCGFLHEGESVQKPSIDRLGKRRADWVAAYDPSSHLAKCTVPTMWVNGTHDKHYVLDSYAKSYGEVKGAKVYRIKPRMPHGHAPGWRPKEIGLYIDSFLRGGVALPALGPMKRHGDGRIVVPFQSAIRIVSAELHYTREGGLRTDRKWEKKPGTIQDGQVVVKGLPADANTWLVTVTDERDAMVTTEVGFRPVNE